MSWRFPAEWEPHAACWISWPCRREIWPNFAETCQAYANVVNAIAEFEPVKLIVPKIYVALAQRLCTADNVTLLDFPIDDSWTRDTLPIFLTDDEQDQLGASIWQFNAWGNKFFPYDKDASLSQAITEYLNIPSDKNSLVLEGGSIHTNGQDTLLTTKQCLLHPNRNPHLDQTAIAQQLLSKFALQHIIWLEHGLDGDVDTDGHVDNVACFIDDNTVLIQSCDDESDPNHAHFMENYQILQHHSCVVQQVPQPKVLRFRGNRIPASYINFYWANGAIIMPSFGSDKQDEYAKGFFKELFTNHEVRQIDTLPIIVGGGGIHCMTRQQPTGVTHEQS